MYELGWGYCVNGLGNSCHKEMKSWVQQNGEFIPLEDYYYYMTYQNPASPDKIWRNSLQFDQ